MKRDDFLLVDKISLIETRFIKNGWVTIYESEHNDVDQHLIFCCLVNQDRFDSYKLDRDWVIQPTSEGKPAVYGDGRYETYSDEGIEPFIFSKHFNFNGGHDSYIEIAEEFVLYFKLYEKGENKKKRSFYFIDEVGDLVEVIKIQPKKVQVRLSYLMEYISVRKVNFSICFDFMRLSSKSLSELETEPKDQDFKEEKWTYNHFIRHLEPKKTQSWIHGKCFIKYDPSKSNTYHFDNFQYESFMTGYDDNGNEVYQSCEKENEKYFVLTYFKKEVLDKYYNDPSRYNVSGWRVSSDFFSLKIDNHHDEYVAVFLVELRTIPQKEQLHWKQYNIPPREGMSAAYYKTMIEGSWAEHSGTPDLFFKEKYDSINKKWAKNFGWSIYKPLSDEDSHNFKSLHIPTTNNIKAFCEQILALVKITIDSLNEKELGKGIELEQNDKGITKFEKFLKSKGHEIPEMIEFLRHLQDLRSGLAAHRFSKKNKNVKRAMEYFNLEDNNLVEVATDMFIKSIFTLNTLESLFLKEKNKK
ncbi:hypothetical protein RQM59_12895 [Flavobacteriaceae bacterium S356]|uniref:ApeA N-terminal domain-containing protein n=1 Tax=Asprobacillus argus TaxID=3076534 RepID=A0ABU3LHT7_9FLAO|nr:hypothetical protein [Flavobacteriaceae bacterium S356]